jgi:hypothetical protein
MGHPVDLNEDGTVILWWWLLIRMRFWDKKVLYGNGFVESVVKNIGWRTGFFDFFNLE